MPAITRRTLLQTLAASSAAASQAPTLPPAAPELAIITKLGPDHRLLQSFVSQAIERGIDFEHGPNRFLLSSLPESLAGYRAILLDAPALAQTLADPASRARLDQFVSAGGFHGLIENPLEGELLAQTNTSMLFDLVTSARLEHTIVHAGLTLRNPHARRRQIDYPEPNIADEIKAELLHRIASSTRWNEYTLHDWKAAQALIRLGGHDSVKAALIASIRAASARIPEPDFADVAAGFFATAWLLDQTGDRAPFDKTLAYLDLILKLRPRCDGVITRSGFTDDPLSQRRRASHHDEGMNRQHTIWCEDLHFYGPPLAAATRITGDPRYLAEAMRVFDYIAAHHVQPNGLMVHATHEGRQVSKAWTRAQTHALYGMLYTVEELPATSPEARRILAFAARLGAALARFQDSESGLWRNLVDSPEARLESSGSVGIFSVFSRAINEGWLPRAGFEPMLRRAWQGLHSLYWRKGLAANCRGTLPGATAAFYLSRPQGWAWMPQFTLALAEKRRLWKS